MASNAIPAERRGAIDVARTGALLVVVFGHLSLAVIDRDANGALRGANLVALHPGWNWVTALSPMPVFFAAGGWANSTATLTNATHRLRTLVGLGAVVVTTWSTASIVELLVRGDGGIVADGARIATQPLWFLAAYVPFTVLGTRLHSIMRRPVLVVGACLVALTAIDVARFAFDAPRWIGWPGFYLAWGVPWLLGCWWRARPMTWRARRERSTGAALAVIAIVACVALVRWAGYSPALIDAVPGRRSNTTPPTLFTAIAALAQVGVFMLLARSLDGVAHRLRHLLDRVGAASVGIYAWHLTALSLCAALLAAGLWTPTRLTAAWWLTRPLWFALVLAVTVGLTALTARSRGTSPSEPLPPTRAAFAAVVVTIGAATVGVIGPRSFGGAALGSCAFIVGWWLLASPGARLTRSVRDLGSERGRSR